MRRFIYVILLSVAIIMAAATDVYDRHGAMVRHGDDKVIHLVFSADSAFEGASEALDALENRGIKASFFFTGNFLERPENRKIIERIIGGGHYVGPHSYGHLLYADWDEAPTPLVAPDSLLKDLRANLALLSRIGVDTSAVKYFIPPYEWIAASQSRLISDSMGITVINPTPGLQVYRDYTTPDMAEYHSSDSLLRQLYQFERERSLRGAVFIMHLGTHPARTDKFYRHLPHIIDTLTALGYTFDRFR